RTFRLGRRPGLHPVLGPGFAGRLHRGGGLGHDGRGLLRRRGRGGLGRGRGLGGGRGVRGHGRGRGRRLRRGLGRGGRLGGGGGGGRAGGGRGGRRPGHRRRAGVAVEVGPLGDDLGHQLLGL